MVTQDEQDKRGQLAVVTGASSGIGLELAKCCAQRGYDLVIAADEPEIADVAGLFESYGVDVKAIETDLATIEGVDELYSAIGGREVDALLANAGHGLGRAFLDQDFDDILHVIGTNITGTVYLAYLIGQDMQERGAGKILFTGSIAGFMPGSFQAVYNGSKAFVDSFAAALRNELKDTGVTVSCLMPGATETNFFARADMLDTDVGQDDSKSDPADVAKAGFEAMLNGEDHVIVGFKNKMQVAASRVMPDDMVAEQHRKMAQPGTANKH
ncbi:MAG: oxidoreductase [Betaproteobacteria bacterium]|nr:oxidoreductase [Betaproteobacteria bacterium]